MSRRKKPIAEINVVPYIDVMLVLLVIFMITTPLLSQGVRVELPRAAATALTKNEKEPIIVSVDKQGKYFLNIDDNPERPRDAQALALKVAALLRISKAQGQHRLVLVKGDQAVAYARVVEVMALLQRAGVQQVGLMTQNPERV